MLGLTRPDKGAEALKAAGAEPHHGTLKDLDRLRTGAETTDGTIHCGFIHDFTSFVRSCEVDRQAIETIGAALAGSDRPFLNTSGLAGLAPGRPSTEEDAVAPTSTPRAPAEGLTLALAPRGVREGIVRLSPSVHGEGAHGFVPILIGIAREKGASAYIGDGSNRGPGVHRIDAARLYRLAVEKGTAGARFHGVADEGVPTREIAEVIGRRLGLPVQSVSAQEARSHFGWMGFFFAMDLAASSALTRERLGWQPTQPGLLADLDQDHYFASWRTAAGAARRGVPRRVGGVPKRVCRAALFPVILLPCPRRPRTNA